jgi:hypothetical protein
MISKLHLENSSRGWTLINADGEKMTASVRNIRVLVWCPVRGMAIRIGECLGPEAGLWILMIPLALGREAQ